VLRVIVDFIAQVDWSEDLERKSTAKFNTAKNIKTMEL
jgi:hypothetical protein